MVKVCRRYDLISWGVTIASLDWTDDCFDRWVWLNGSKQNLVIGDLPSNRKTIGAKLVLKVKRNANGSIHKQDMSCGELLYLERQYRLQGDFSLVIRFVRIHLLLAIITYLDLKSFQIDVNIAFLNGEIDKQIYKRQYIGFEVKENEHKVYCLKCSINSLRKCLASGTLGLIRPSTIGFKMREEDHYAYRKIKNDCFVILSLYINEILLTWIYFEMLNETKS